MLRSLVLANAVVLALAGATLLLAQDGSWVGKRIMTRKAGIQIASTADKSKQVYVGELKYLDYTVLAEQGDRLKVIHQGVEGWLDKTDAVLSEDALPYFTDRIKVNPNDDDSFHRRGVARMLKGEYEPAIQDLSEAIRLNPKESKWWDGRGNAHRMNKDPDRAIADYNEAIRLDRNYGEAFNNRGAAHRMKKDYERAMADFSEAMRLDPKDAAGFNSAAWLFSVCPDARYRNGKKAIELATRACELTHWKRPGYIDTLAAAYAETGQFEEAVKYQSRALEDTGYQQRHGGWARKVLELYKDKKPYRED